MKKRSVPIVVAAAAFAVYFIWTTTRALKQAPQPTPPVSSTSSQPTTDRSHAYAGLPEGHHITLLKNKGYLVGYSESRRNPLWVAYRIFKIDNPQTHKRPSRFRTDERTQSKVRHQDYTRSGYDRGHMAPNHAIDICYGEDGQKQTFLMSNICPQKPRLNQRIWRNLEMLVAKGYAQEFEEVWIVTGPVFDQHIEKLSSGVEIPDAFYKILVDDVWGQPRVLAFIMPQSVNGDEPVQSFLVSVDTVEKKTGLDFFSDLKDELEERLESAVPSQEMWQ